MNSLVKADFAAVERVFQREARPATRHTYCRAHLRTLISQMYTARDFRRYREYEALKRTFRQAWSKRHDR